MGLLSKLFSSKSEEAPPISSDFNRMMKQLYKKGSLVDTHFLYLQLIDQTYARRKEPEMRALFMKLAFEHIEQFDYIKKALLKDFKLREVELGRFEDKNGLSARFPHVPTFQHLATVYTEDKEYEKAIEVCEKAITFGLSDWTKSGYQGRIERIKKKIK